MADDPDDAAHVPGKPSETGPDDGPDGGAGSDPNAAPDRPATGASGTSMRSREVVVPMRLYKTVTVFTTLFSAILVVGGFILLDTGTNRARAPVSEIDPVFTVLGLAAIAGGGLLFAFASRFRAAGMGKDKDDSDEPTDNG